MNIWWASMKFLWKLLETLFKSNEKWSYVSDFRQTSDTLHHRPSITSYFHILQHILTDSLRFPFSVKIGFLHRAFQIGMSKKSNSQKWANKAVFDGIVKVAGSAGFEIGFRRFWDRFLKVLSSLSVGFDSDFRQTSDTFDRWRLTGRMYQIWWKSMKLYENQLK